MAVAVAVSVAVAVAVSGGGAVAVVVPVAGLTKRFFHHIQRFLNQCLGLMAALSLGAINFDFADQFR